MSAVDGELETVRLAQADADHVAVAVAHRRGEAVGAAAEQPAAAERDEGINRHAELVGPLLRLLGGQVVGGLCRQLREPCPGPQAGLGLPRWQVERPRLVGADEVDVAAVLRRFVRLDPHAHDAATVGADTTPRIMAAHRTGPEPADADEAVRCHWKLPPAAQWRH